MKTFRLVAVEVGIGIAVSVLGSILILLAIGNLFSTALVEGTFVFLMAMGIGIVVWIALLIVARRITAKSRPGIRILADAGAALIAVVVNGIALPIVLGTDGGAALSFQVLFLLVPASIAFGLAALIANVATHVWLGRDRATPPVETAPAASWESAPPPPQ